jgi:hypothetical protein
MLGITDALSMLDTCASRGTMRVVYADETSGRNNSPRLTSRRTLAVRGFDLGS